MSSTPPPPAASSSTSAIRLTGPARVRNLRSALRGLSISDPIPPTVVSPRAPMSSTIWTGSRRTESSPPQNSFSNTQELDPAPRKNDAGPVSRHASEEATDTAQLLDGRLRQLKSCTRRLRAARVPGSDPGSVDSAYEEFSRAKDEAAEAVGALLAAHKSSRVASRSRRARNGSGSVAETVERLESLRIAYGSTTPDGDMDVLKASFSTFGLGDSSSTSTGSVYEQRARHDVSSTPIQNDPSLAAIQDWRAALVKLLQSHKRNLAATIQAFERDATPYIIDRAVDDLDYRAEVIQKMRTRKAPLPSNALVVSPAYWPSYEKRFQHYDAVRETIMQIDRLVQMNGQGPGERPRKAVRDYVIAPRGNAILEFANSGGYDNPLIRFRVSSHMLAETSPIFEAVFGGQFSHPRILDRDLRELDGQVPREPPRSVTYTDGSRVKLYSMPQLELNKEEALTVLLHAAHMQNDKVPREVSFAQFTAIAEVCLKYQCTSPLELFVEHRWLPAWMHKATEPQPDGILLISYAFGMRQLFTRMSKTSVLNIEDEEELRSKPWPHAMKEKIWAVRNAKMAQVYNACVGAVQEYFRPPSHASGDEKSRTDNEGPASPREDAPAKSSLMRASSHLGGPAPPSYVSLFSLTSKPRCPRGDHWCDATSLGWLLLVLNELQLVWTVVNPSALPDAQGLASQPCRSLAQLLDVLRSIPSPPHPAHPGSTVCDPAPAFRAAVNDVYNSISGLTLFDVDGKRHGWGLSKHRLNQPQKVQKISLGKLDELGLDGLSLEDGAMVPARTMNDDTRGLLEMEMEDWLPASGTEAEVMREEDDQQGEEEDRGDDRQYSQHDPPAGAAPDEALCLRIMRHADTFDDLHALALVSRAFYSAFKTNELALMRPLVSAWQRRTLGALRGGPAQAQDLRPEELARLEAIQARSEERKRDCAPPSSPPPPPLPNHHSVDHDSLAEAAQLESSYCTDREGGSDGEDEGVEPREMTEEEAGRILWPDEPTRADRNTTSGCLAKGKAVEPHAWAAFGREDSSEKFLAGEISLSEEKSLAVLGDKSLGEDLDRRKGITSA
ncbi:hypothetical protein Daus18300_006986 [Diaporthe australafricana]|uniref:BTB domain-containing protein n=1 Tax=Diaporthe australafricana TaxID=127596 RepID=A0ABR3WR52_9PEZI